MLSMALLLATVHIMPSIEDFDPENPFWNGLRDLYDRHTIDPVDDLRLLPSKGRGQTLLILGPSKDYGPEETAAVSAFLADGGQLLIADDFGSGNSLLQGLGLGTRFSSHLLVDPLFNGRNSQFPRATQTGITGVGALTLNYATVIELENAGPRVLAWSSSFSYLDQDRDGARGPQDPEGPFALAAKIGFGDGEICLISDPSVFINGMIGLDDNGMLLESVAGERSLLIDGSHGAWGGLAEAKRLEAGAYDLISRLDLRYAVLIGFTSIILRMKRRTGQTTEKGRDEVEEAMREHPDWDRQTLLKLKRDLEELGPRRSG